MNINNAYPSNYLKAADLQGREATVTVARIDMEDIGGDHKPVIYFQGKERGLVLNKTNAMNIATLYGPETEGWIGKPIVLYSCYVDFQGRSVEAIRVKPTHMASNPHQHAQQAQEPVQPAGNGRNRNLDDDLSDIPF